MVTMVWYGVVWYGMVWCGMVWWYGMVWYGVVWCGVVWCGVVWYGMVWYGMVWYGMVWYVIFQIRASFNIKTGGDMAPPAPLTAPPVGNFVPPSRKSLFIFFGVKITPKVNIGQHN